VGQTNLEVDDIGLLPTPTFDIRIGSETGFQEDQTVVDVTDATVLNAAALATVAGGPYGSGVASINGADTQGPPGFPESDGTNPAGYRVIIDAGGGNEETITVSQLVTGTPGTFTFTTLTSQPHANGESIELLNDVLTMGRLTSSHVGNAVVSSVVGHLVEVLLDEIEVASGAQFPVTGGGYLWLNFGKEVLNQRQRITVNVAANILELATTDDFPTTGFPYRVVVSEGRPEEEYGFVTANNTGTDRLTFTPALVNTHLVNSYVRFVSGTPESLAYDSISGTTISIAQRTFDTRHIIGERVMYSPQASVPNVQGSDYAFLLPPDPAGVLSVLVELVRAAGIEVVFLSDR
jgi:hypothetical protein